MVGPFRVGLLTSSGEAQPMAFTPPAIVQYDHFPESGTLQIVDDFTAEPGPFAIPTHGQKVSNAALYSGYRGVLNQVPLRRARLPAEDLSRPLSPEQTLAALDLQVQSQSSAILLAAVRNLDFQRQAGVRHTVTNFSQQAGPAYTTQWLYLKIRMSWQPPDPTATPEQLGERVEGQFLSDNLARAWKLDAEELRNPGPTRQRFQQNLIQRTQRANHSPALNQLRRQLNRSVEEYEAGHNSVVTAAGNSGQLGALMQADNGGRRLQFPGDYFDNVLSASNVTTVGASQATYSNPSHRVNLLAAGTYSPSSEGTSFAAPVIAAQMQTLHNRYPQWSSAKIERMLLFLGRQ